VIRIAAAAFTACLAGFVFCAIASAWSWHPAFTRPFTVVFVLAAIGCAVWLNWTAGSDEDDDAEDEEEAQ
jgi:protein-S-isoprenylcysteine O-methyltransferase Ste14